MNEFLTFRKGDIELPGDLYFATARSLADQLSVRGIQTLQVLQMLSAQRVLMILPCRMRDGDDGPWVEVDGRYDIYTEMGMLRFRQSETNELLLYSYSPRNFMAHNRAHRDGVCFHVNGRVITTIRLNEPYNWRQSYSDGIELYGAIQDPDPLHRSACQLMQALQEHGRKGSDDAEEDEDAAAEYQPNRRLAGLLDQAYNYADLDFQREQGVALALGDILYYRIEAPEYDRNDRICYEFIIDDIREELLQSVVVTGKKDDNQLTAEDIFKPGTAVEVTDRQDNRHTAEVGGLRRLEEDDRIALRLLFADQISAEELPATGTLSLSINDVNRRVQETAIERIRTGRAPAKYMDQVLGEHTTAGFDNKDLSAIDAQLMARGERAPNESQMQAIHNGINARDVYLVMGPPGTGKTTVILEWVKYFVQQEHKRVLVSSQNNKAVDNVLERLAEEQGINTIRIGSELKLQANVVPFMFENKVRELRHQIIDDTDENLRVLSEIEETWQAYRGQLVSYIKQMPQVYEARQRVLDGLRQLADEYHAVERRMREYQTHAQDSAWYRERLRQRDISIAHIRQQTGIARIPARLALILADWLRRQDVVLLEQSIAPVNDALRAYQEERAQYLQQYAALRDHEYADCLWLEERILGRNGSNLQPPARDPRNIWNLFDNVLPLWQGSSSDPRRMIAAIDNEMDRLDQLRQTLGNWQQQTREFQNYALNDLVLEMVDLVGATCIGINSRRKFANLHFDVTIIDEAGQIQIHNALVPMSVSNKLIMLGDHKQIPPMLDQELVDLCQANGVRTNLLEKSLFEQMYHDLPETNRMMLDTQYRMPAEIAETISEWFYEGKYYSPSFKEHLTGLIPQLSRRPYVVISTSDAALRYEHKTDKGCENLLEADIIAAIVRNMWESTEDPAARDALLSSIGIISAYKAQIGAIKRRLNEFLPVERVNEMAATLDSYQGQERDLILYSYTRSSDTPPQAPRIGFLNELRRLNVAMTRCKKTLVLIGDMDFLSSCEYVRRDKETGAPDYDKSEQRFSEFIRLMLRHVENGGGERLSYQEFCNRMNISAGRSGRR